ncbi:uncharacterized protein RSE6_08195 [Rhynchosporium secalis]|uniref:Uncharacterized protein n=1 Tax=Rhynchosporium secalis TaxID=38038 RepID=A0A1E1MET6_RHYSE|nr:uncharacterized protein RSE6_08195 [Rhynchosporium secalis]
MNLKVSIVNGLSDFNPARSRYVPRDLEVMRRQQDSGTDDISCPSVSLIQSHQCACYL